MFFPKLGRIAKKNVNGQTLSLGSEKLEQAIEWGIFFFLKSFKKKLQKGLASYALLYFYCS
jgi:hypothetical protein